MPGAEKRYSETGTRYNELERAVMRLEEKIVQFRKYAGERVRNALLSVDEMTECYTRYKMLCNRMKVVKEQYDRIHRQAAGDWSEDAVETITNECAVLERYIDAFLPVEMMGGIS